MEASARPTTLPPRAKRRRDVDQRPFQPVSSIAAKTFGGGAMKTPDRSPLMPDADRASGDLQDQKRSVDSSGASLGTGSVRHPVEQAATAWIGRFRTSIDSSSTDRSSREASETPSAMEDFDGTDLLPVVSMLEAARRGQADYARSWASLGPRRPERLGDFRLQRPLGRGGMGVVFEAYQESLQRTVALKILPPGFFQDSIARRRFLNEAKTIASLHHTNIVPIYGVGFDEGCHYFVMQRIEGHGLDEILSNEGRLSAKHAAGLASQAALALAHGHEHGIIHRDVKPSNLLVAETDELWVTDFGVAKTPSAETFTKAGDAVGTLRYMAPEQITGTADARSDVYSLGVTLYEMVTGRAALSEDRFAKWLAGETVHAEPPPVRRIEPSVPKDLATVIEKAIHVEPAQRYASAAELANDLQRFSKDRPVSVRPPGPIRRTTRWIRRRPVSATLTGMLLLTLTMIAGLAVTNYQTMKRSYRAQARAAAQTEQTLLLATDALQQVFDSYTPTGSIDAGVSEGAPMTLDATSAQMLEQLVPFYDRIAKELDRIDSMSEGVLDQASVSALRTIASIQMSLGHYDRVLQTIDEIDRRFGQPADLSHDEAVRQIDLHLQAVMAARLQKNSSLSQRHDGIIRELLNSPNIPWEDSERALHSARADLAIGRVLLPGMNEGFVPPSIAFSTMASKTSSVAMPSVPNNPGRGRPVERPRPTRPPARVDLGDAARRRDALMGFISVVPTEVSEYLVPPSLMGSDGRTDERWADDFPVEPGSASIPFDLSDPTAMEEKATLLLIATLRETTRPLPAGRTSPARWRFEWTRQMRVMHRSASVLRHMRTLHPTDDILTYQLALLLSEINVFDTQYATQRWTDIAAKPRGAESHGEQNIDIARLREASELLETLSERHPHVPTFTLACMHCHFKLGCVLERAATGDNDLDDLGIQPREWLTEALRQFRISARMQYRLIDRAADTTAYRVWQVLFLYRVADTHWKLDHRDDAREIAERMLKIWERVESESPYDDEVSDVVKSWASRKLATQNGETD